MFCCHLWSCSVSLLCVRVCARNLRIRAKGSEPGEEKNNLTSVLSLLPKIESYSWVNTVFMRQAIQMQRWWDFTTWTSHHQLLLFGLSGNRKVLKKLPRITGKHLVYLSALTSVNGGLCTLTCSLEVTAQKTISVKPWVGNILKQMPPMTRPSLIRARVLCFLWNSETSG